MRHSKVATSIDKHVTIGESPLALAFRGLRDMRMLADATSFFEKENGIREYASVFHMIFRRTLAQNIEMRQRDQRPRIRCLP
jgi:hypothetical protein